MNSSITLFKNHPLPPIVKSRNDGRLNKQIAGDLGTVEKTIKVHRGRVMEKMGVRSIAELVRLTGKVGISGLVKP